MEKLDKKIAELRSQIKDKKGQVNETAERAIDQAENGNLDQAKQLKDKVAELKKEVEQLQGSLADLEEIAGLSEPQEQTPQNQQPQEQNSNNESEQRSMPQTRTLINPQNEEVRSFENFLRTEQRDGLNTENTAVVIPQQVVNSILKLKQEPYDLSQYVTKKSVSTGKGTFPVVKRQNYVLQTKEESAANPAVPSDMLIPVNWSVNTRAGQLPLSNELIEDSAIDIVAEVKNQLSRMITSTDNSNIINLLKTFPAVNAANVDDIKHVFNTQLDPALSVSVVLNQSAFDELDKLKDKNDRFLLQDSITAASGKTLFGRPVIIVSDQILANGGTTEDPTYPIIFADLEESVFLAQRSQLLVDWEKFDSFSRGLAVSYRADYQKIDANAAVVVNFAPVAG